MNTTKKELRIGLDIDDVIADFCTHFFQYLDFEDKSPATEWEDPRIIRYYKEVLHDNLFWKTMPKLTKPENINFKPVMYVTARGSHTKTDEWLKRHNYHEAPVYYTDGGSKVDILKGNVDIFIDDSYKNYLELNKNGIKCLLFDRPHNRKYDVGKNRIYNIEDVWNID